MKVALVHDHFLEFGGAERVVVSLKNIYPDADVYTSYYDPRRLGKHAKLLEKWNIRTSWADRVWGMKRLHSPLRFVYPWIWESFDFSDYDLVISSSATSMSRGIITRPDTLHISYVHHPPRYLYGYETAREWRKHWPIRVYAHLINFGLRSWDYDAAQRPDYLIANSHETALRIKKFYDRESTVIYPPVTIPKDEPGTQAKTDYYITTSRLARAKHIDILIRACNQLELPLRIIGSGRDLERLRVLAGPTIEFLTDLDDPARDKQLAGAKGFLFASRDEDFGIAPVEAMGYGVPVIAYGSGGLLETVKPGKNGLLYDELTVESLARAIAKYERLSAREIKSMRQSARKMSKTYSQQEFAAQITSFVKKYIGS